MKKLTCTILILSLAIIPFSSAAQCNMKGEYGNLIELEVYEGDDSDQKFLIKRIAEVDATKCYAEAINRIPVFFDYLKTNFSDHQLYADLNLDADSVELRKNFETALAQDVKLTSKLDEYFMSINGKLDKEKVLFEEVRDIAAKFFSIIKIDEQDRYVGKACVGINMIENTLPERKPFVEAFVFAAIMSDLKQENSVLMANFKKAMKELYNNNLGTNKEERLLRAQGMMMYMMKTDTQLNGILATYYAKHQALAPFIIQSVN